MPVPAASRKPLARKFARQFDWGLSVTATMHVGDILAAADAVYDFFDLNGSDMVQAASIQQNLLGRLPEPFKSGATNEQKGWLVAGVALVRAGVL